MKYGLAFISLLVALMWYLTCPNVLAYEQRCNVSAYTPYESGTITASGKRVQEGMVAADHLPFGTVVIIRGKRYVVEDRFGGGYTDRIDIFMNSYDRAIEFGRQWIKIEVIE